MQYNILVARELHSEAMGMKRTQILISFLQSEQNMILNSKIGWSKKQTNTLLQTYKMNSSELWPNWCYVN